ncbi:MAG: GYF domain-containing protein [Fimbriimonadaceae bacterium]|nr:GYF domain-containing protein [Fimbriimonadaceae bacterium]
MGEWFYIGQFGQLGPLTLDQMEELVSVGVITPETYVWKDGLPNWVRASDAPELVALMRVSQRESTPPPPPPSWNAPSPPVAQPAPSAPAFNGNAYAAPNPTAPAYGVQGYDPSGMPYQYGSAYGTPVSDRSRVLAGVLQMLIPGVGRMYLGYAAIGVLQLLLAMCVVGYIWSFIDGVMMLIGTVKMDGYGRKLAD